MTRLAAEMAEAEERVRRLSDEAARTYLAGGEPSSESGAAVARVGGLKALEIALARVPDLSHYERMEAELATSASVLDGLRADVARCNAEHFAASEDVGHHWLASDARMAAEKRVSLANADWARAQKALDEAIKREASVRAFCESFEREHPVDLALLPSLLERSVR